MKCDDCVNLLEAYVDGEVDEHGSERVRKHLMTCLSCETEFEALTAESELYARYDRELQISPAAWSGISARIAAEPSAVKSRERRDVRGWFAGLLAVPRLGFAFSGAMAVLLAMFAPLLVLGCATGDDKKKDNDFFTSGDREADQRSEQRMAKDQQLKGEGQDGKDDKGNKKRPLYERLGGEQGVAKIVDDFLPRVLADPRVNWERKGVERGGFSLSRGKSVEWNASPQNVATLKKHLSQFIALATGGPPQYDGKEMAAAHKGLHITNAEFDATIGDLKATLDKLAVPTDEQKELLAIVESTRTQVAAER